jgi:NAD(P)H dehydrogenase (quinone)
MATDGLIAVTGATGGLGGRVARRLAGRGVAQRLVVRDAARAPELDGAEVAEATYGDGQAMRRALDGVATLLLVSASEAADRVKLHTTAVDAAVAAGVERVVYTSFFGAAPDCTFTFGRDHWHTEQALAASGLRSTFLRDNLYIDFLPLLAGADGVIRGPGGAGRVAAVARDDIADAAVAVLLGDSGGGDGRGPAGGGDPGRHDGRGYDMTGPEALTLAEVAGELSRFAGRPIVYREETIEEAYASRASYGAPDWEVDGWVSTYTAIANGDLERVSGDLEVLTGHPPMRLADFLAANPDSYRHLAGPPGPHAA